MAMEKQMEKRVSEIKNGNSKGARKKYAKLCGFPANGKEKTSKVRRECIVRLSPRLVHGRR